jgi:hypothetical protein
MHWQASGDPKRDRFIFSPVLLLEKTCANIELFQMIALTFQIDLFSLFFFWYNDSAIIS